MIRRPPRTTRTDHSFPTRRSSDLAVYVLADGNAVSGSRLNAKGEPIDQATLQSLVAKPISDQAWADLESATWVLDGKADARSEEHTSELQSLMRISYAVFCLEKKKKKNNANKVDEKTHTND